MLSTYNGVHWALNYRRGRAATHDCVDCGGPAAQWSLMKDKATHTSETLGPYSLELSDYEPRCIPCHKKYDLGRLMESGKRFFKEECKNGHAYTPENDLGPGKSWRCAICYVAWCKRHDRKIPAWFYTATAIPIEA